MKFDYYLKIAGEYDEYYDDEYDWIEDKEEPEDEKIKELVRRASRKNTCRIHQLVVHSMVN